MNDHQASLFDELEGRRRRDEGVARVWGATDDAWKELAYATIQTLAASGDPFTAEDVRIIAGDPPRYNAFGALFQLAARRGLIRKIGFVRARRPSLHASDLAQWVGMR